MHGRFFFNCDFFLSIMVFFKIIESKSVDLLLTVHTPKVYLLTLWTDAQTILWITFKILQSGQENLQKPVKKRLLSHKNFLQSIIYNDRSADTIQLVMVQNQKCDVSNFNFGIFQARTFSRLVWAFDLTSYSIKNLKNVCTLRASTVCSRCY